MGYNGPPRKNTMGINRKPPGPRPMPPKAPPQPDTIFDMTNWTRPDTVFVTQLAKEIEAANRHGKTEITLMPRYAPLQEFTPQPESQSRAAKSLLFLLLGNAELPYRVDAGFSACAELLGGETCGMCMGVAVYLNLELLPHELAFHR
jgi:hypothetical protein